MWTSLSASITRRVLPALLIPVLAGCGGPRPLDTGPPVIDAGRELTQTLWRKDVGRSVEFPPLWAEGSWLVAPTEGSLWRLDAETGTRIWKKKIPSSPTASPLLAGDLVVMTTDAPSGEVVAFHLDTGEEAWKWGRAITVPAARDTALILAARGGKVIRLDPADGKEVWTAPQKGAGWRAPVFVDTLVVVPGRPDSLVAYRIADGTRVWSRTVGAWPVLAGDGEHLVAATDDSVLVNLDPHTGETRARTRLGSISGGPPLLLGNSVVVALRSGSVMSFDLDSLSTRWQSPLESPLVTPPFYHQDRILQAAPKGLICSIEPETGEILGVYRHPEPIVSAPRGADSTVVVGGDYGTLIVYRGEP